MMIKQDLFRGDILEKTLEFCTIFCIIQKKHKLPGMLLLVDFEKAFNSVS